MKTAQIRFEVRELEQGCWYLYAVPCNTHGGWAPVQVTRSARGTPSGAIAEFVFALNRLKEKEDA